MVSKVESLQKLSSHKHVHFVQTDKRVSSFASLIIDMSQYVKLKRKATIPSDLQVLSSCNGIVENCLLVH